MKSSFESKLRRIEKWPVASSMVTSLLSLVVSVAALVIPTCSRPPDQGPIRELIKKEAELARVHDIDGVVALFSDTAIVRDLGAPIVGQTQVSRPVQSWIGRKEIRARYEMIKQHVTFPRLSHLDITVNFDALGTFARAFSSTDGSMVWDKGAVQDISTQGGEQWEFEKVNGQWRITSATFHSYKQ